MSQDRFVVRAVVVFLGITTLVGLIGIIWLISRGGTDPGLLAVVAGPTGTSLGALGTLLARTNADPAMPQAVNVVNPPAHPVPVDPAP